MGDTPSMYMYIYQNTTDIEYRKYESLGISCIFELKFRKYKVITEIDKYRDNGEALPDNLTDYFTVEEEARLRTLFFGEETAESAKDKKIVKNEKVKQFKKTRFAQFMYWLDRKSQNVRRGSLLVYYAMADILTGNRLRVEHDEDDELAYMERYSYIDGWVSPFRKIIVNTIDKLMEEAKVEEANEEAKSAANQELDESEENLKTEL